MPYPRTARFILLAPAAWVINHALGLAGDRWHCLECPEADAD